MLNPRRTFVVRVYPRSPATLEDVRSGRLVVLNALDEVGGYIADWLGATSGGGEPDPEGRGDRGAAVGYPVSAPITPPRR